MGQSTSSPIVDSGSLPTCSNFYPNSGIACSDYDCKHTKQKSSADPNSKHYIKPAMEVYASLPARRVVNSRPQLAPVQTVIASPKCSDCPRINCHAMDGRCCNCSFTKYFAGLSQWVERKHENYCAPCKEYWSRACAHKGATKCSLTMPECCACADQRPHKPAYETYVDGRGAVHEGKRWSHYCSPCKTVWAKKDPQGRLAELPASESIPVEQEVWRFVIARHRELEGRLSLVRESLGDPALTITIPEGPSATLGALRTQLADKLRMDVDRLTISLNFPEVVRDERVIDDRDSTSLAEFRRWIRQEEKRSSEEVAIWYRIDSARSRQSQNMMQQEPIQHLETKARNSFHERSSDHISSPVPTVSVPSGPSERTAQPLGLRAGSSSHERSPVVASSTVSTASVGSRQKAETIQHLELRARTSFEARSPTSSSSSEPLQFIDAQRWDAMVASAWSTETLEHASIEALQAELARRTREAEAANAPKHVSPAPAIGRAVSAWEAVGDQRNRTAAFAESFSTTRPPAPSGLEPQFNAARLSRTQGFRRPKRISLQLPRQPASGPLPSSIPAAGISSTASLSTSTLSETIQAPPTKTCSVCSDDFPSVAFPSATAACKHSGEICIACLASWITSSITTTPYDKLKCPSCPSLLSYADVQRHTTSTPQTWSRYEALVLRAVVGNIDEFVWCLNSACGSGQIHVLGSAGPIFRCNACASRFCVAHKCVWHEGETCKQFDARKNVNVKKQDEASEKWIREKTKPCPKCRWNIEKNNGCDHMTCRKCAHQFCWLCFADYEPIRRHGNKFHQKGCKYYA